MIKASDFGPTRRELLEEVSRQAEVLDRVSRLMLEQSHGLWEHLRSRAPTEAPTEAPRSRAPTETPSEAPKSRTLLEALPGAQRSRALPGALLEALPEAQRSRALPEAQRSRALPEALLEALPEAQRSRALLLFWEDCVSDSGSPFCCQADSFCRTLRRRYTHKLKAKQPGQSERVFSRLLQQVQAPCRTLPPPRPPCSPLRVTLFQLSVYMKRWSLHELGEHISRLSREEHVLSALRGPRRRRALGGLRGRSLTRLLPLGGTLHTLANLITDPNHKTSKAAAACISRAAAITHLRNQALLFYSEGLRSSDLQQQLGSCLALKRLRAVESVDLIAELWRSADEDVRAAARETVLSFGKQGQQVFQRMDQLDADRQEEAFRNQETQTTIL